MASSQLALPLIQSAETRFAGRRTPKSSSYSDRLLVNHDLTRALVSFQANKDIPFFRWLKYKEAFSAEFVNYILGKFRPRNNSCYRVLDPFAGVGTTLTVATLLGCHATGIELLPVGIAAINARLKADKVSTSAFERCLSNFKTSFRRLKPTEYRFPHLRITEGAFPPATERGISAYQGFLKGISDHAVRYLFWFASLSVLEEISFTRKDGQYLRWDARSGKRLGSQFNKGAIHEFESALTLKLETMLEDIHKRNVCAFSANVKVIEGSSLEKLAELASQSYDLVITSPPYCNRYDYTRTYALELAYFGYSEDDVKTFRQRLLSATVENKSKRAKLLDFYRRVGKEKLFWFICEAFEAQEALQEVLRLLLKAKESGLLNNTNVPCMVEQYFFEMNFIIHDLARVLAPGGKVVMVNDNVQYIGEEVPVDLILSDFACHAGLSVERVWVLPRGKGNSSQQMDVHGRNEIRKCVYVWTKPLTG